jgi:hypothetical protein
VSIAALPTAAGARTAAGAHTAAAKRPHVLFGAYVGPRRGQSLRTAVTALEHKAHRKLAAVRVYDKWDSKFPNAYTKWLRHTGHTVFLSVLSKRSSGALVPWRRIAAARPGSSTYARIVHWARAIKAFGAPLTFTFNHEPEASGNTALGSNKDFVAAWRNIVHVFRSRGVKNVKYLWIMTSWAFVVHDQREASRWYPGNHYVDMIGGDAYNWFRCRNSNVRPWESFGTVTDAIRKFGRHHPHKGLVMPEYGSVEQGSDSAAKRRWLASAASQLEQPGWGQFVAVLYFDQAPRASDNCLWALNSSKASMAGFTAMGSEPYFQAHGLRSRP